MFWLVALIGVVMKHLTSNSTHTQQNIYREKERERRLEICFDLSFIALELHLVDFIRQRNKIAYYLTKQ